MFGVRVAVAAVWVVALGLAAPSGAEPPGGGVEAPLQVQLEALQSRPEARQVAGDALDQSARALRRAAALKTAGHEAAAQRARQIAAAALLLAQRQVALAQERAAHRQALARLETARRRARAARHALDLARKQHQTPPPPPPAEPSP